MADTQQQQDVNMNGQEHQEEGTPEQLAARLRSELAELQQRLQAASKPSEYGVVADRAVALCRAAAGQCRQRQKRDESAKVKAALDKASAAGLDPAAAAAAAAAAATTQAPLSYPAVLSLLPNPDDGKSCMLLRLNPAWSGGARVTAFAGRFGAQPVAASKTAGHDFALLTFGSSEERARFAAGFRDDSNASARAEAVLRLPGEGAPLPPSQGRGRKRGHEGGGDGGGGSRQQQQQQQQSKRPACASASGAPDIRSVVCPLWSVPYGQQLSDKVAAVCSSLRKMSEQVGKTYTDPARTHTKPAWLAAALKRHDKLPVPLLGIYRSPQLNGYRNKAEFSVGLDDQERPIVGFLQGNFVDGHTQVADPSGCRHMSATSLAFAAAATTFLRSSDNTLPVWDKRDGKGFWRLLVVREGRSSTFLPLPTPEGSSQSAVLTPGAMAGLPAEKWFVRTGAAGADAAAAAAAGGAGEGLELSQVTEVEAPAPAPSQALVMVQVNPLAAEGGPAQIKQQLIALAAALRAAAAQQGLPLTSLAVQYHSGVSNAAPPSAPITPLPAAADADARGDAAMAGDEVAGVLGIQDALCEMRYRVSPTAFYQINPGATCLLYHTLGRLAAVGPDSLLLDVCCGTGTIGLTLAKQVAAVVGVDNVASAIEDAKANAVANGVTNASFVCGAAEHVMGAILEEHAPKYAHAVAIVDPPRAGLHKDVLFALLTCPRLKRLVFVACNSDALAFNAGILCGRCRPTLNAATSQWKRNKQPAGEAAPAPLPPYTPFRPTQALAFDLFPHTHHVEAVVVFERD